MDSLGSSVPTVVSRFISATAWVFVLANTSCGNIIPREVIQEANRPLAKDFFWGLKMWLKLMFGAIRISHVR